MLFDEVISALDPNLSAEVLRVMRRWPWHAAMAVVTHEMGFAREVADRAVMMDQGETSRKRPPADFFTVLRTTKPRAFLQAVIGMDMKAERRADHRSRARLLRLPWWRLSADGSQDAFVIRIHTDGGIAGWAEADRCLPS